MTTQTQFWTAALADQLDLHWQGQLRPRLDGLGDDEYFWEPSQTRGASAAAAPPRRRQAGSGDFTIDFAYPEPDPAPVTTIAWRIGHMVVGVLGASPPTSADRRATTRPGTTRVRRPERSPSSMRRTPDGRPGVRALDEEGLARPCGPAGGPYAEFPMATLVLHINREMIHHGAEVALLRDLYTHRPVR